jgi:hypothetical protein
LADFSKTKLGEEKTRQKVEEIPEIQLKKGHKRYQN